MEKLYYDKESVLMNVLIFIAHWFMNIGVIISCILILYFIFTLKIVSLLLFGIGLGVAFLFGYFFMFLLDKLLF